MFMSEARVMSSMLWLLLITGATSHNLTDLSSNISVYFDPHDLVIELNSDHNAAVFEIHLTLRNASYTPVHIELQENKANVVALSSTAFALKSSESKVNVTAVGVDAGHVVVSANITPSYVDGSQAFVRIRVYRSKVLDVVSTVVGWIYFVAWTISFYPQICENYRRKSVIGLNLDFLVFNFLGHLSYFFFNVGLYWIQSVQDDYHKVYPHGVIPVQLNDVVFSIHAVFATFFTIMQACVYTRGSQRISLLCIILMTTMLTFLSISLILSVTAVISWLEYLNYFSYVKLAITLLKYCPQAYQNCRHKSTDGWSIGNVLLDFTGGFLSIVQMFMIAYNFNDWSSIFGDPTKFGLGLFSVLFDILFMVQHYVLYRQSEDSRPIIKSFTNGDATPAEHMAGDL